MQLQLPGVLTVSRAGRRRRSTPSPTPPRSSRRSAPRCVLSTRATESLSPQLPAPPAPPPPPSHPPPRLPSQLLGASIDSKFCHLAFSALPRTQGGLGGCKFPLLADVTKSLSEAYDVLITEGPDAGISLRCARLAGEGPNHPSLGPQPLPPQRSRWCLTPARSGLFIIDTKGTLRQATVNDLPVGRSVDEALRLVKAFQFVDQHGEVCPANWTPGEKTMKADPTGSLEYFSKLS